MLLASYDDGSNIGFWDGLRPQRKQAWKQGLEHAPIQDAFINKDECPAPDPKKYNLNQSWEDYHAPRELVEELAQQLKSPQVAVHALPAQGPSEVETGVA